MDPKTEMTTEAVETALNQLIAGHAGLATSRIKTLRIAIELGADTETLAALVAAQRVNRAGTIVLPAHRFELLSRGRGWARQGKGSSAVWGERTDGGYRVGPGRWKVGGNDGFRRQGTDTWTVSHVVVGGQTWTVAE